MILVVCFCVSASSIRLKAQTPENWTDTSGDSAWENAINWDPPIVPNSSSFDVIIGIDAPCALTNVFAIHSLRLSDPNAVLYLLGSSALTISSEQTIANDGYIQVNSEGIKATTTLALAGNGTIGGSGLIELNGVNVDNAAITMSASNSTLSHSETHTIEGRGDIKVPYGTFVNNGTIAATVAGSLLRLSLSTKVGNQNNGLLKADNGATLALIRGTIDESGGGSIVANGQGSYIQMGTLGIPFTPLTVRFGSFSSSNGGVIGPFPNAYWDSCTNSGQVIVDGVSSSGSLLVEGSGLTNNGTILISDAPGHTGGAIAFANPSTNNGLLLDGTGEIILDGTNPSLASLNLSGGTLTQSATHRIHGRGRISGGGSPLRNNGLVSADVPGGTLQLNEYTYNNATLEAVNGGILRIDADIESFGTAIIQADGPNSIAIVGPANSNYIKGPHFIAKNSGIIQASNPQLDGCTLDGEMKIVNHGTVQIIGNPLTNNGLIVVGADNTSSQLSFEVTGAISGNGTIQLVNSSITVGNSFHPITLTNPSGQTIAGTGAIQLTVSDASMVNNGTIAPGLGSTFLLRNAVAGKFSLGSTSVLAFQVAGTAGGTSYSVLTKDQFDQTSLQLHGTLLITLSSGFTPSVNDVFNIITTNVALSGAFANVASGERLNTTDGAGSFRVDYFGKNVALSQFGSSIVMPKLQIATVGLGSGGHIMISGTGPPSWPISIQRSPSLTSDFIRVASTSIGDDGNFTWQDLTYSASTGPQFYRVSLP